MDKIKLTVYILLLSFVLCSNLSFGDDKTEKEPVILKEFQKAQDHDGLLSNDLPSVKGLVKSFILVIGLIIIFFVFLKWRYGFSRRIKGNKKYIQVLEHSFLGPKKYLYLVKVFDKLLVVGSTNDGLSLLCEMSETERKELLEKSTSTGEGFSSFIKKITSNKNNEGQLKDT